MNEQDLITSIQPELIISDYLLNPDLKIRDFYGDRVNEFTKVLEIINSVTWHFQNGKYISSNLLDNEAYKEDYTELPKDQIQCLSEINYLFKLGIPRLEYRFVLEDNVLQVALSSGDLTLCMINKEGVNLLEFASQMELIDNLKEQKDWFGVIRAYQLMLYTPDYLIPPEKKYLNLLEFRRCLLRNQSRLLCNNRVF